MSVLAMCVAVQVTLQSRDPKPLPWSKKDEVEMTAWWNAQRQRVLKEKRAAYPVDKTLAWTSTLCAESLKAVKTTTGSQRARNMVKLGFATELDWMYGSQQGWDIPKDWFHFFLPKDLSSIRGKARWMVIPERPIPDFVKEDPVLLRFVTADLIMNMSVEKSRYAVSLIKKLREEKLFNASTRLGEYGHLDYIFNETKLLADGKATMVALDYLLSHEEAIPKGDRPRLEREKAALQKMLKALAPEPVT